MNTLALSFEQMRESIFRVVLESLTRNSYSDLHTSVITGKDPRQIVLPRPEDAMYMGNYGTLSLNFNIPDEFPLTLNISFMMGRISYSVQVETYLCERAGVRQGLVDLGAELGLRCDWRPMHRVERYEFSDDRNIVSTEDMLNILKTPQLEAAFREFITLQIDKLVIGIASLLADAGVHREIPPGVFAICVVNSGHTVDEIQEHLVDDFEVFACDGRDPHHIVYGLVSLRNEVKPIATCVSAESKLRVAGVECTFRPTFKYSPSEDDCRPDLVAPQVAQPKATSQASLARVDVHEPPAPVVWETVGKEG